MTYEQLTQKELERQQNTLELIASENIADERILNIAGSVLTNKYAEGQPNKRYYGGCEWVDKIELKAKEDACNLFKAEYANVQPHSGSQANMAVYYALLELGDTIMGLSINSGGHLSHGTKINFSGKYFNGVAYDVNPETYLLDYDEIQKMAIEHKPKIIVAGGSAYPRKIDFKKFREIADKVGAYLMVDMAHIAGLVATELHENPVKYADVVTSTTHKTLRGPRGGLILCKKEFAEKIDKAVFPGIQGGPLMHIIAGKGICFEEAKKSEFVQYQKNVIENAKYFAQSLQQKGLNVLTGGTDNHLLLLDLRGTGMTGLELETKLDKVRITLNKNAIPFDNESKMVTSGVRIGTPAITTRGLNKADIEIISDIIANVVFNKEMTQQEEKDIIAKVREICNKYPIYSNVKYDKNPLIEKFVNV